MKLFSDIMGFHDLIVQSMLLIRGYLAKDTKVLTTWYVYLIKPTVSKLEDEQQGITLYL